MAQKRRKGRHERAQLPALDRGTEETRAHVAREAARPGSLARLHQSGAIDAEQLAAAHQIAELFAAIAAGVAVRTADLEPRSPGSRATPAAFESAARVKRELAYNRWRRGLGGNSRIVLAMIVDDLGLAAAAAAFGMGVGRARRVLGTALDDWIFEVSGVRRTAIAA